MRKSKLIQIALIFCIGVCAAFTTAKTTRVRVKHTKFTGYTEYFAVTTTENGSVYNWTTVQPGTAYTCINTAYNSQCEVYVSNSYTPQANTPIPTQYLECPSCVQPSNVNYYTGR